MNPLIFVFGDLLALMLFRWSKTMEKEKVRFFMDYNDTAYVFKEEGLPYGPGWTPSKIEKQLKGKF